MNVLTRAHASNEIDARPGYQDAPRAARVYALALLVVASVAVCTLVLAGASMPPPELCLLLAVPLAVCMNRYVFFPNEVGVTTEAAVIFAAAVAFRGDAAWLGPLVIALLVGPLDARHWRDRSFARMAFNSGSQAVNTLAALVVFVPLARTWGPSWTGIAGAVLVATVPYVVTESLQWAVLFALLGAPPSDAVRGQLALNTLTVTLVALGASGGWLALEVGWWVPVVMLPLAPLLPELVLVRLPRRVHGSTAAMWSTVAAALSVVLILDVIPQSRLAGFVVLCVMAVGAGIDSRVDPGSPIPALAAVVLAVALVLARGDARVVDAVLVVIATTVVAWSVARRVPRRRTLVVPTTWALITAALSSALDADASRSPTVAVACVVAVAYLVVAMRPPSTAVWLAPFVVAVACLAAIGDRRGAVVLLPVAGGVAFAAGVSCWGAPPWRSRVLGPWGGRRTHWFARLAFAAAGAAAVTGVAVAAASGTASGRDPWLLGAAACAEADLAMAMCAVRQWRFAPRRRAVEATVLFLASGAVLGALVIDDSLVVAAAVAAALVGSFAITRSTGGCSASQLEPCEPTPVAGDHVREGAAAAIDGTQ